MVADAEQLDSAATQAPKDQAKLMAQSNAIGRLGRHFELLQLQPRGARIERQSVKNLRQLALDLSGEMFNALAKRAFVRKNNFWLEHLDLLGCSSLWAHHNYLRRKAQ